MTLIIFTIMCSYVALRPLLRNCNIGHGEFQCIRKVHFLLVFSILKFLRP